MVLGKKGIIFSLIALGLSSLFIVYFSSYYELPLDQDNSMVQTRVRTLDRGIDNFYDFAEDALVISGYNALQSMYFFINKSTPPAYFSTFENNFIQCAWNGTLANYTSCKNTNNYEALLNAQSQRLLSSMRIDITPTINSITLREESWWYFLVDANVSYSLHDEFADWTGHRVFTVRVPKEGVYDPAGLYLAYTYQFITIENSPHRHMNQNFLQDSQWNYSSFKSYMSEREYRQSTYGPCLSQRFMGDWSAPAGNCGVETIINPKNYQLLQIYDNKNLSHVDYQILNKLNYSCFTGDADQIFRVGIEGLDYLVLSTDIASRFNLENNWTSDSGYYTAPHC